MTTGKDIASFFENGTTEQFEYCFKLYPQVLKLKAEKRNKKPQELIRLDEWYQNELPKLIKARGKDAHMVYDELVQTMKWKQSRGKFYPQLSYLVKVNTPRAVMQETKKAFRKLPNLEQAITALSNLKGVGTTMASALLAAASPDSAPFMADECLMAIPEIEGIDYTTKEYLNFVQHIQATVTRLNTEAGSDNVWSPHRVELALWSHYVANDLSPELLEEMPGPGAGGGAKVNGSTAKPKSPKDLDGGEDTNDAYDESLVAGRGDINNIATESETDNENTNPTGTVLQDGDSNFVSNDSIDENTTQTTATTSTDDGTPLASDSESNIEAPLKANATTGVTGAAIVAPILPNTVKKNGSKNLALGNGNGTGTGDSLDGDNSNCIRSSANEDASEEDDDEDRMVDESSNSNSLGHKSVTPIINLNDGTTNTDNDSTLSSAGIVQKRSLHCSSDGIDDGNSQPEMKKIRSE